MYSFCPHCGKDIGQDQVVGQLLACRYCGKEIGMIRAPAAKQMIDENEALIQAGTAARCPHCQQAVAIKTIAAGRAFVPHMGKTEPRRMCPSSGKPVTAYPTPQPATAPVAAAPLASPIQRPPTSKDLSRYITRDFIKVVSCKKTGDPLIEELTLEYLDKTDRVRIQIEALREIVGPSLRMKEYPRQLGKPYLAIWGDAAVCVVGKKHATGGLESMTDPEILPIVSDLRQFKNLFFQ